MLIELRAHAFSLFRRQIDDQQRIDACRGALRGIPSPASALDRIEITHQDDRCFGIAFAELGDGLENISGIDATLQRTFGAFLDDHAIGHRIGKRHAEFDHVGAGLHQRVHAGDRAIQARIAGGDERHQGFPALRVKLVQLQLHAVHGAHRLMPSRSAMV